MVKIIRTGQINKAVVLLIPVPLIANVLYNSLQGNFSFSLENSSSSLELINLLCALFLYFIYLSIGTILKKVFNFQFINTGIVVFWLFILIIENIFI